MSCYHCHIIHVKKGGRDQKIPRRKEQKQRDLPIECTSPPSHMHMLRPPAMMIEYGHCPRILQTARARPVIENHPIVHLPIERPERSEVDQCRRGGLPTTTSSRRAGGGSSCNVPGAGAGEGGGVAAQAAYGAAPAHAAGGAGAAGAASGVTARIAARVTAGPGAAVVAGMAASA